MDQFRAADEGDLKQLRVALTEDNVNDVDGGLSGWRALDHAARGGHIDYINYCIEMGANVNADAKYGCTPLHRASSYGHVNIALVLLDVGALVDVENVGRTPPYLAICDECFDVARLLVDRGAKVSNVKLDEDLPSLIGSPRSWNRDPIVVLFPLQLLACTNTVVPM
jgi:hypothetical protein